MDSRPSQASGVPTSFLDANPEGVGWDCSMCAVQPSSDECATCVGHPTNQTQCAGLRWSQLFPSVPSTMWFVGVTMTTVGCACRQQPPPSASLGTCRHHDDGCARCLATVATVRRHVPVACRYGDRVPQTWQGQLFCGVLIVAGVRAFVITPDCSWAALESLSSR